MLSGPSRGIVDMQPKVHLSLLTSEDIPLLEPLENCTNLAFWGAENYRRFLDEFPEYFGYKVVATAEDGMGNLAGFFLARALFENLEILKVGVYPEYQRQGIGTYLMDAAYTEGIKRGCCRCFLEVRKSNLNAIQFYCGHKFKIAGTRPDYYTNPVEDAWIMEKTL
jgi:[ribosomal protein S18]-alanine N-acetyltransferase